MMKGNSEINPITIKPETASHVAEQISWVPLPSCSAPGHPFLVKSLALSAHVSPRTIHFLMLKQEPTLGPWKGVPLQATESDRNQTKVNKMMRITDLHTNN